MLPVSDGFKAAVVAPSRRVFARVKLEVLDNDAWLDNTKTASSEAPISRLCQVTNRVRDPVAALATFEPNYWRLDGSFVLPPAIGELPDSEVGWWSANLCDADGLFAAPETVNLVCGALYNAAGITVTFDPAANEYATSFTITAYDANDAMIYRADVTDNTAPVYLMDRVIPQFKRVEIVISRWVHGQRRARVTEIDFGLIAHYGEGELVDMSLINELDPTSASLPAGELHFRLDNSDKRFNILNPQGLYYFLQRRQRITAELGVEIGSRVEYVPSGIYYLTEWKSDTGALTASFVARDVLDLLDKGTYRLGVIQDVTAYALVESILADAGLTEYAIDAALQNVILSACVPILSHREALQLAAVASCSVVKVSRLGDLRVERLTDSAAVATVDYGNMLTTPEIELEPLVTSVDVAITGFRAKGTAEVYNGTLTVAGRAEVWVQYESPCRNHVVTVTGGTLTEESHYAYTSRLVIIGAGEVNISVTADEMEPIGSKYTLSNTDTLAANTQPQTILVSNPLIHTQGVAADVAAWQLAEAKRRKTRSINWRQNPALECGDIVIVEDDFGLNLTARITKQEIEYMGFLSGKTEVKGG